MKASERRKIIHIDMDCFYAAIEMRDNPALRGKPIAVGGTPEGRGVVATCSYEARQYGVHSAMPMSLALRKCPRLVVVPSRMSVYREVSSAIQALFQDYTDLVEPLSLDEAYLDVTASTNFQNSATRIAQDLRARIAQTQDLTASAGVAANKFLAKIASDWRKPNGLYVIRPHEAEDFVRNLAVKKIPGVGAVTASRLHDLGVDTCEDLQRWTRADLQREFGRFGERLFDLARGIDERPVTPSSTRKSISVEDTFSSDLPTLEQCTQQLPTLFQTLQQRLQQAQQQQRLHAKTLFIKLRFHDFVTTTAQAHSSVVEEALFVPLLQQAWARGERPVRLLGIGVQFEAPWYPEQLSLSFKAHQR